MKNKITGISEKVVRKKVNNWLRRKGGHKLGDYPFTGAQFVYLSRLTENDWRIKYNDPSLTLANKVRKIKREYTVERYNAELALLNVLAVCKPKAKFVKKVSKLKYKK